MVASTGGCQISAITGQDIWRRGIWMTIYLAAAGRPMTLAIVTGRQKVGVAACYIRTGYIPTGHTSWRAQPCKSGLPIGFGGFFLSREHRGTMQSALAGVSVAQARRDST